MRKYFVSAFLAVASIAAAEPYLVLDVASQDGGGEVVINLRPDLAPLHVERIIELANSGAYDGIAFHRVIDGFMAQTGDVENGKIDGDLRLAGTGGSELPNLPAEFTDTPFDRGVVGMARSQSPNSANSQFFIMFAPGHFLNGQYTVFGEVHSGMEIVDQIKRGDQALNGTVTDDPDYIKSAVIKDEI